MEINTKIRSRKILNIEQKNKLLELIDKEMLNQFNKFKSQNHSFEMWFMILMEEIAEISQEYISYKFYNPSKHSNYDYVRKEITQSITLLVQMLFGLRSTSFE